MPKSDKQRNNLCHNVRRGINPLHQPSRELQATEFIRKTLVNKETDLERFRQGDVGYISELIELSRKAGKHPARYRRAGTMTDKFNQVVCDIILDLFNDTELPYRIEHWNVRGQYKGLGLFATRSTKYKVIVKATQDEQSNAELLWSSTTGRRHDCVFESEWSEYSAAARASGWWWKKHYVNEDRDHTMDERVWLKARFAIRGRLMFANHKPDAPFHFSRLTQHSPRHHTARVTGKVNYRAKDPVPSQRSGKGSTERTTDLGLLWGRSHLFVKLNTEYVADFECRHCWNLTDASLTADSQVASSGALP
jgi:hypothetical protein